MGRKEGGPDAKLNRALSSRQAKKQNFFRISEMGCCSKRLYAFFSIHFQLFPKAKNDKSYVKC